MAFFKAHGFTYECLEDLIMDQLAFDTKKGETNYSLEASLAKLELRENLPKQSYPKDNQSPT